MCIIPQIRMSVHVEKSREEELMWIIMFLSMHVKQVAQGWRSTQNHYLQGYPVWSFMTSPPPSPWLPDTCYTGNWGKAICFVQETWHHPCSPSLLMFGCNPFGCATVTDGLLHSYRLKWSFNSCTTWNLSPKDGWFASLDALVWDR